MGCTHFLWVVCQGYGANPHVSSPGWGWRRGASEPALPPRFAPIPVDGPGSCRGHLLAAPDGSSLGIGSGSGQLWGDRWAPLLTPHPSLSAHCQGLPPTLLLDQCSPNFWRGGTGPGPASISPSGVEGWGARSSSRQGRSVACAGRCCSSAPLSSPCVLGALGWGILPEKGCGWGVSLLVQGQRWPGLAGPELSALLAALPSQLLLPTPGLWYLVISAVSSQTGCPGGGAGPGLTLWAGLASGRQSGP